jgi:hypothetical protein
MTPGVAVLWTAGESNAAWEERKPPLALAAAPTGPCRLGSSASHRFSPHGYCSAGAFPAAFLGLGRATACNPGVDDCFLPTNEPACPDARRHLPAVVKAPDVPDAALEQGGDVTDAVGAGFRFGQTIRVNHRRIGHGFISPEQETCRGTCRRYLLPPCKPRTVRSNVHGKKRKTPGNAGGFVVWLFMNRP